MKWNDTLDAVLGNRLRIRIIRTLHRTGRPVTGRALAQAAGYSHTQTYKALDDLEALGVITKDYAGAAQLYELNRTNYVVREMLVPVLTAERRVLMALASRFYERFGKDLKSITLFGSVARNEDEPDSDIDLILVTRDGSEVERLEGLAAEVSLDAALEFGGAVSAFVVPESEYRSKLGGGKAMWSDIKAEGVTIDREAVGVR
jgi:predicted nucleotidyltransferase